MIITTKYTEQKSLEFKYESDLNELKQNKLKDIGKIYESFEDELNEVHACLVEGSDSLFGENNKTAVKTEGNNKELLNYEEAIKEIYSQLINERNDELSKNEDNYNRLQKQITMDYLKKKLMLEIKLN